MKSDWITLHDQTIVPPRWLVRVLIVMIVPPVAAIRQTGCSPPPRETDRIGINAWPGYAFLYLAQENGFYRDEGLDVGIVEFNSLSDARRAYQRGQVDAFGTTVIEVLQARDSSERSPQILHVVDSSEGADVILTQPGLTNAAALKGTRVGVELGSPGMHVLSRCLDQHGLGTHDVTLVSPDQMSMEQQFGNGEIDAIVAYPPTSVNLLKSGKANTFFTTAEMPGEVIDVIAIDESLIQSSPESANKLSRALQHAVSYCAINTVDAYRIMAIGERMTPGEFAGSLRDEIQVTSAAEQQEYLRPGNKLGRTIDSADRSLRNAGQINGPDRQANIPNALPAATDDSSQ